MKEEQIDNYVRNKMSQEERVAFEQELAKSSELQKEVALHRDIVRAIKLKAAKEHLRQLEIANANRNTLASASIPWSQSAPSASRASAMQPQQSSNLSKILRWSSIVAVAACCAMGLFIHYDNRSNYMEYGQNINMAQYYSRGESSEVNMVIEAIQNSEYESALNIIEQCEKVAPSIDATLHPDLHEQLQSEYKMEQDDLQWYKAVVYMRAGKWYKAKRLLEQIANSDSYYKEMAREALDAL